MIRRIGLARVDSTYVFSLLTPYRIDAHKPPDRDRMSFVQYDKEISEKLAKFFIYEIQTKRGRTN